ncbi:MAG: hypothetical protein AABZ74_15380 [Cyanobacteriota bacterium]
MTVSFNTTPSVYTPEKKVAMQPQNTVTSNNNQSTTNVSQNSSIDQNDTTNFNPSNSKVGSYNPENGVKIRDFNNSEKKETTNTEHKSSSIVGAFAAIFSACCGVHINSSMDNAIQNSLSNINKKAPPIVENKETDESDSERFAKNNKQEEIKK